MILGYTPPECAFELIQYDIIQGVVSYEHAKALAESIVSEKGALFDKYEQDIYDTIMTIANKVTLDSLTAKDSVVVRKLIKKLLILNQK
mgnify:CR=1 FL=1